MKFENEDYSVRSYYLFTSRAHPPSSLLRLDDEALRVEKNNNQWTKRQEEL